MKNNVTLAYVYSNKNAGDMAINLGAISLLNEIERDLTINLISRYDKNSSEYNNTKDYFSKILLNKNYCFYPSPFILNRNTRKGQVKNYLIDFFKYFSVEDYLFNIFHNTDIFFFNGGNLIRCENITDFLRLIALTYPLKLANKFEKPIIILPNSTKKISKIGLILFEKYFLKSKIFMTREEESFNYLKNIMINRRGKYETLFNSVDLAFFINKIFFSFQNQNFSFKNHIALTFRFLNIGDIEEFAEDKKEKIMNNILKVIKYILSLKKYIVIVAQTEKDINISKQIYELYKSDKRVTYFMSKDPLELKQVYSQVDLVIGMRLHSIILALSEYTPAIGIFDSNWGLKNPGTMEKFGLPYRMNLEIPWDIEKDIKDILENRKKYSQKIKEIIQAEKLNIIKIIKDVTHFRNR